MKESKKSKIRKMYFFFLKGVCIVSLLVGYLLFPTLKYFGYCHDISWLDAWTPALFLNVVVFVPLFAYFSAWILKEGNDEGNQEWVY